MTTDFNEAFLFLAHGADPDTDRIVDGTTLYAFVPDAGAAAHLAAEVAERGARLIELYRGFDLAAGGRVVEAVAGRAPVGVPAYGYGAPGGGARRWAAIFWDPTADGSDPVVVEHADGSTTTIARAAGEEDTARAAAALVGDGVEAIELCGATTLATAARVVEAVGDRASVGTVSWAFESLDGVAAYKAAAAAQAAASAA
jgi:hypothetical protein